MNKKIFQHGNINGDVSRVLSSSEFGCEAKSKMVIYIVVDIVVVCGDKSGDMVGVV